MHLMYYLGADGKRVYTLKVCCSLSESETPVTLDGEKLDDRRKMASLQFPALNFLFLAYRILMHCMNSSLCIFLSSRSTQNSCWCLGWLPWFNASSILCIILWLWTALTNSFSFVLAHYRKILPKKKSLKALIQLAFLRTTSLADNEWLARSDLTFICHNHNRNLFKGGTI